MKATILRPRGVCANNASSARAVARRAAARRPHRRSAPPTSDMLLLLLRRARRRRPVPRGPRSARTSTSAARSGSCCGHDLPRKARAGERAHWSLLTWRHPTARPPGVHDHARSTARHLHRAQRTCGARARRACARRITALAAGLRLRTIAARNRILDRGTRASGVASARDRPRAAVRVDRRARLLLPVERLTLSGDLRPRPDRARDTGQRPLAHIRSLRARVSAGSADGDRARMPRVADVASSRL